MHPNFLPLFFQYTVLAYLQWQHLICTLFRSAPEHSGLEDDAVLQPAGSGPESLRLGGVTAEGFAGEMGTVNVVKEGEREREKLSSLCTTK